MIDDALPYRHFYCTLQLTNFAKKKDLEILTHLKHYYIIQRSESRAGLSNAKFHFSDMTET